MPSIEQLENAKAEQGRQLREALADYRKAIFDWMDEPVGTDQRSDKRHKLQRASRHVRNNIADHAAVKRRLHRKRRELEGQLGRRAYDEAVKLIGVMEHGANNRGPIVEKIIHYAQGQVPEPWCVDFNIWCYGHAGSEFVKPGYPRAVVLMYPHSGVRETSEPRRGDMVRFTFDHTGLFSRALGGGMIETIEGNTGASGSVSDSSTGGDGVYRKQRHVSLVRDFLKVAK